MHPCHCVPVSRPHFHQYQLQSLNSFSKVHLDDALDERPTVTVQGVVCQQHPNENHIGVWTSHKADPLWYQVADDLYNLGTRSM
jgi:hypothetical protein